MCWKKSNTFLKNFIFFSKSPAQSANFSEIFVIFFKNRSFLMIFNRVTPLIFLIFSLFWSWSEPQRMIVECRESRPTHIKAVIRWFRETSFNLKTETGINIQLRWMKSTDWRNRKFLHPLILEKPLCLQMQRLWELPLNIHQ